MRLTGADLAELDEVERRFSELTLALRADGQRDGGAEGEVFAEWMRLNHAFHDVIYRVAAMPYVEQVAKSARRSFIGGRVLHARAGLDEMVAKNDLQHRAIRDAMAAGQRRGSASARPRPRAVVVRPDEVVLDAGRAGRDAGVTSERAEALVAPRAASRRRGQRRGSCSPSTPSPRPRRAPRPRSRAAPPRPRRRRPRPSRRARSVTAPTTIGTWVSVTVHRQVQSSGRDVSREHRESPRRG